MNRIPDADLNSLLPPLTLNRRGFIATALATGFTLAAGPIMAKTAITTDTNGLTAGEISIPVSDGNMPAYRAMPANAQNAPVILVVQEIFGVHEYIKDVCRRLAKAGYMAIAPELYARQGDPSTYTEVPKLFAEIVSKVPDAQVMSDLDAAAAWAGKNGGNTQALGITGFCWGGRIVWLYSAHSPSVKAGVAWYGRLVGDKTNLTPSHPTDVAAKLNGPVLGLYGGADAGIPQDTVDAMKAALAQGDAAAKASKFIVYPDAPHAFHADYRPSYREAAAKDGWQQALAWFDQQLK
ncbi:dienelactone hydrolase family protein [Pusillimonas minor]|uniref:Dienelactone hydrolase family protein n=1 Tax=Pusillimonas minor TaxID=2697024 RepID=A0A842HNP9_9BURK|nr:dienelactone hydrolase family protein [Pusillimonas minor]MBC2769927.1 dienelactone hydrolase family protein [Pusillimonas minor]